MSEPKFDHRRHYVHVAPGKTALLQNVDSFDFFAERRREGGKLKEVEYLGKTPPLGFAEPPKNTGRRVFSVGIDLKRDKESIEPNPDFSAAFAIIENEEKIAEIEKRLPITFNGIGRKN